MKKSTKYLLPSFLLLVAIVTFSLSSCEEDFIDDNTTKNEGNINNDEEESSVLGDKLKNVITGKWSAFCWDPQFVVIVDFKTSGLYSSHQYYVSEDVVINGENVSASFVDDMGVFSGEWNIKNDRLNFIYADNTSMMGDQDWEIVSVSSNKFILKYEGEFGTDVMEFNRVNNNISDKDDSYAEMKQDIKSNVYKYSTYSDFTFHIKIETRLSEIYPNKYFKYGIEMGYGSYDYYADAIGSGTNYYVDQPVYIFADGSPYFMYSFNWRTYQSLLADMKNGPLTANEKTLYNETVKILKTDESEAKSSFIYRVYVNVDGIKYYL